MINRQTYEEYFLLYTDRELSPRERAAVEKFVEENPELKKELDILEQSVFTADESIVFENKDALYRKEQKAAVVFFNWKKMSAAAAVLIFFGLAAWMYFGNRTLDNRQPNDRIASINQPKNNSTENKHITPSSPKEKEIPKDQVAKNNAEKNTGINNVALSDRSRKEKNYHPRNNIGKAGNKINGIKNNTAEHEDLRKSQDDYAPEDVALKEAPNAVNDVALADHSNEKIKIAVQPRHIASPETKVVQNTIQYADENDLSDNNRIYVANTSFSKRNSLRVVFRKASRIIDRITTLQ